MKHLNKFASATAFACIAFSSPSFATTPTQDEPVVLSSAQMDEVTAGLYLNLGFLQLNVAPVVITQIRVLNFGIDVNWTDTIQNVVQSAIRSRR